MACFDHPSSGIDAQYPSLYRTALQDDAELVNGERAIALPHEGLFALRARNALHFESHRLEHEKHREPEDAGLEGHRRIDQVRRLAGKGGCTTKLLFRARVVLR